MNRRFPLSDVILGTALLLCLVGCATQSSKPDNIETQIAAQRYDLALQTLTAQRHAAAPDDLLYLLNKAMLLRMNGDYAGSNQTFTIAKSHIGELTGLAPLDSASLYAAADFEKSMLHVYMALNYLQLGDLVNARAEVQQQDVMPRSAGDQNKEANLDSGVLGYYLGAMISENLAQYREAMTLYRKAYVEYQRVYSPDIPDFLKRDLLRLAQQQGLDNEVERYKKEFHMGHWLSMDDLSSMGELVFVFSNGLVPLKREQSRAVIDPVGENIVRIALPYYEARPVVITAARVTVAAAVANTEIAEDINVLAAQELEIKLPGLTNRAMARAVVKAKLAKRARQNPTPPIQPVAAAADAPLTENGGAAIEHPDTRHWLTLPANIQLARLPLPPGNYTVRVDYLGNYQALIETKEYTNVTITQGGKTYLAPQRTASSSISSHSE